MTNNKSRFRILAIETSCDETAASVVEFNHGKINILSNVVASQVKIHAKTFGVVPEIASRCHAEKIIPIIREALNSKSKNLNPPPASAMLKALRAGKQSQNPKIQNPKLNAIAVTVGPGLFGSLLVGVEAAKTLAFAWNLPLIPVNHLAGHIAAAAINSKDNGYRITDNDTLYPISDTLYPALALIVSGGHTELVLIKKPGQYQIVGETLDDAAGECFDKTARILGLGYPGGPAIAAAAAIAEGKGYRITDNDIPYPISVTLPRPMLNSKDFNFSFSGLKTAVLYAVQKSEIRNQKSEIRNIFAAEIQDAIVEVLVKKTIAAANHYHAKVILVGGGVSANQKLREEMEKAARKNKIPCYFPEKSLSTDNAAMIGLVAVEPYRQNKFVPWWEVSANSQLSFRRTK